MGLAELYGCVVLPQFAAQAVLRRHPSLRGRPVVVMEGESPMEWVLAMNRQAAEMGVQKQMTRVEVETFGDVTLLARCVADEEDAQTAWRNAASRFTPRVEERGGATDWECVLDLCGMERLLGEPAVIVSKLKAAMLEIGLSGHAVICANADAGLSLARAGKGTRVVARGEGPQALAGLPVGVLGLDEEQQERFDAWGIKTLGELAALPEVQLIARMGQSGKVLLQRARGELPHHLQPLAEAFLLEETLEFDEPVETLDPLLFCMNVMLERLLARALERSLALASVTVSLWMERCADRVVDRVLEQEEPVAQEAIPSKRSLQQPLSQPAHNLRREQKPAATSTLEARLGMASADAAVRKAWHRAALTGRRLVVEDVPPVRGEALRERLGIGDGQAMRRKAAALHLVREDVSPAFEVPRIIKAAPEPVASLQTDEPHRDKDETTQWGQPFERTIHPAVPLVDRRLLLKMLQLDLEAHPAPGAIVRLRLSAESGRAGKVQLGLFAPPMPEPTRFEDTHARLVSLVGANNMGRAQPLDTHAEEQFEFKRFQLPAAVDRLPETRAWFGSPAITLRRMRPPLATHVTLCDQRIEHIWLEGIRFEVQRCYGPWRTSGKWWGTEVWSLDLWDVAAENNNGDLLICLVAWDLLRERWSLSGIYD